MHPQIYIFPKGIQIDNRIFSDYSINILHIGEFRVLPKDVVRFRTHCEKQKQQQWDSRLRGNLKSASHGVEPNWITARPRQVS